METVKPFVEFIMDKCVQKHLNDIKYVASTFALMTPVLVQKSLFHVWASLHAQVSCGRCLSRTSSDRGDRQPPEEEVHGGQQRLEEADGAES